jgi:microcystin-dependent protein
MGVTAPAGYMMCDGSEVSRSTYLNLFNVIGTTFGAGDGSTTFNIPNLQGVFLRGAGNQLINNVNFNAILGHVVGDQMQGHAHAVNDPGHHHVLTINGANVYSDSTAGSGANTINNDSGGNNGTAFVINDAVTGVTVQQPINNGSSAPRLGFETAPAHIGVNYIIKY